jgi:hypothetical protein
MIFFFLLLCSYLSNVTDAIVNVDEVRVHEGRGGMVDRTKTDLYVHLVNRSDHSILPVHKVLNLIDSNVERLDQLFKVRGYRED